MSLCNIKGTLQDSGGQLLAGQLWVQADSAVVNSSTTPHTTVLPRLYKFAIAATASNLNINLHESETARVTYHFQFWATNAATETGLDNDPLIDFHAFVPNLASVDFSELIPTGVSTDSLDTAIARLARLLTTNQQYAAALRGGPRYLGEYNAATHYQLDDCVSYAGSSWIWISATPAAGQTPAIANSNWMQSGAKGDSGGTGGQDTAFNSAGWDGALWAPSANAVRDFLVTLAPLANAALTGNPTAPTQTVGNNTTRLATTAFTVAEIVSRLNNAALTGNPTTPNQDQNVAIATNGGRVANCKFVKDSVHRYSRIVDSKASGTNGGSAFAGIQTRTLNSIVTNSGDVTNLSSNRFTLRAGTYRIFASAPGIAVNAHRIFLWNATSSTRTIDGKPSYSNSTDVVASLSLLQGTFTIAANTDFEIRHYCLNAFAGSGLGGACGEATISEIFTEVELWRID
ncbi:hypothetical protein IQ268_08815 [Oculatella sp. LEGE 06141]|uniref:hypothetical protein n=1 Tax=Oculatella sp. LEGE 06141 TaxID=1828648 RepID=UPI0018816D03|nr:hypothetical protein [Oculatella sp. LEGE 06141]MBE9178659.1 hypothetical protein [Oculatella sp. LEGE 06141]